MVLIMFCNGDKICKEICLSYFGINIFLKILLFHPITEDPKTENRPEAPWDRITSVIWHYYVLNMFVSRD